MKAPNPHPKLEALSLAWPTDWTSLFGEERRLILEIGFGYGQMFEYLHQTRTDANIIGIEISSMCLTRAETAIPRKGLHRARVIRARAETALNHLFMPGSVSEIHVNFPDPWFKERHAGRRLMQRDTLDAIVSRLTPGGKFYLATDISAYAEMSAELLVQTPGLTNQFDTAWVTSFEDRVTTKYEGKALKAGRTCHYFYHHRNHLPAPDVPVIEEIPMSHLVIKTPVSLNTMVEAAQPQNYDDDEHHVEFKNRYLGENNALFEAHIHEPTIDQRVALTVVQKAGTADEYTIKASAIGSPRSTNGVHKAIALLGDAILALSPDAKILSDTLRR